MELVRPAGQVVAPETRPFWVRQRDSLTHQASQLAGESSPPLHSPLPSRAEGEQGGWGPQVAPFPGRPQVDLQQTLGHRDPPPRHPRGNSVPNGATVMGEPHVNCQQLAITRVEPRPIATAPTRGLSGTAGSPAPCPALTRSTRLQADPSPHAAHTCHPFCNSQMPLT